MVATSCTCKIQRKPVNQSNWKCVLCKKKTACKQEIVKKKWQLFKSTGQIEILLVNEKKKIIIDNGIELA